LVRRRVPLVAFDSKAIPPLAVLTYLRLLMFKADGSFLVHDDAGGFRPLNWIRREFRPELA